MFAPTFTVESDAGKNRVTRAIEKNDRDGNGKISRGEWKKSKNIFNAIDADGDGFLNLGESRARFGGGNTKETKKRFKLEVPPKSTASPASKVKGDIYFIDAHSQWDHRVDDPGSGGCSGGRKDFSLKSPQSITYPQRILDLWKSPNVVNRTSAVRRIAN